MKGEPHFVGGKQVKRPGEVLRHGDVDELSYSERRPGGEALRGRLGSESWVR